MKSLDNDPLVLGLVGNAASGKDRVASIFESVGFIHFSTSELVREEIYSRGLIPSRQLQTTTADEVRLSKGGSYFVQESLRRIKESSVNAGRIVLSGLYAVSEGVYLVDELGGELIGIVTSKANQNDISTRYQRLVARADGTRDNLTEDEFMAAYARENGGVLPVETNVDKLIEMARYTIVNGTDTVDHELALQVHSILEEVS